MKVSFFFRKAVLLVFVLASAFVNGTEQVEKDSKSNEHAKKVHVKNLKTESSKQHFVETKDLLINYDEDVLTLSFINKFEEKINFKIMDDNGTAIYKMTPSSSFIIHKRLITSRLPEGKYGASLKVGNEEFTKYIYVTR